MLKKVERILNPVACPRSELNLSFSINIDWDQPRRKESNQQKTAPPNLSPTTDQKGYYGWGYWRLLNCPGEQRQMHYPYSTLIRTYQQVQLMLFLPHNWVWSQFFQTLWIQSVIIFIFVNLNILLTRINKILFLSINLLRTRNPEQWWSKISWKWRIC